MKIKQLLFVVSLLLCAQQVYAQDIAVTGQVTDSETGETLFGVSILVEGTTRGGVTDMDGNYEITVREEDEALIFSYVGYRTLRVPIDDRTTINVSLEPEIGLLDDVIVTAFGIERERRALGYSLQDVDGQEIVASGANSLLNALQGQVSGVQINRGGGGAGQGSQIFIRGFTSLDPNADNQPLFVVDGVPISNETIESTGRPRGMSNRAMDIDPQDIASVSVLRSAPATALYGVRAANGAVIITTKSGRPGEVRVNFSHSVSREDVINRPDYQDVYGPGFGFNFDPNGFWPSWGGKFEDNPTYTMTIDGQEQEFPMQYY
ncbi:MAG: TonB-dependent receptor plug domain-containing protein, partial [Bacteroidota bacterium]